MDLKKFWSDPKPVSLLACFLKPPWTPQTCASWGTHMSQPFLHFWRLLKVQGISFSDAESRCVHFEPYIHGYQAPVVHTVSECVGFSCKVQRASNHLIYTSRGFWCIPAHILPFHSTSILSTVCSFWCIASQLHQAASCPQPPILRWWSSFRTLRSYWPATHSPREIGHTRACTSQSESNMGLPLAVLSFRLGYEEWKMSFGASSSPECCSLYEICPSRPRRRVPRPGLTKQQWTRNAGTTPSPLTGAVKDSDVGATFKWMRP